MAVATTIPTSRLFQILLDVRWPCCANVNLLLLEIGQEMPSYGKVITGSPHSVLFFLQVIFQFGKPRFVAGMQIGHVHLQLINLDIPRVARSPRLW